MKNPICDDNDIELSYEKNFEQIPKVQNFPPGTYYVNQFLNFGLFKTFQENQSVQSSIENLNATAQTDLQIIGKTSNKIGRNQKSLQQDNKKLVSGFQSETIQNSPLTSPDFNFQSTKLTQQKSIQEEKKTQTVQGKRSTQKVNVNSRSKSPYTDVSSGNSKQTKLKLTLDQQSNSQQSTEIVKTPNLKQPHSALTFKKKQFSDIKQTKHQDSQKTPLQVKNINPWGDKNEIQQKKKVEKKVEEKKENKKKVDQLKETRKNTKTSQMNQKNKNKVQQQDDFFDESLFQERISKFNTISDPMSLKQQLDGDDEVRYYQNLGDEEIEEQLEIDVTNKSHQQMQNQIEEYFNQKEIPLKVEDKVEEVDPRDLEDSLECDQPYRNFEQLEESKIKETEITQNSILEGGKPAQKPNFYEQQFNEIVENNMRPTSPPFLLYNQESTKTQSIENVCIKLQDSIADNEFLRKSELNNNSMISNSSKMLEVVYDPVLNCYYHPPTNTYYELNEMQNN